MHLGCGARSLDSAAAETEKAELAERTAAATRIQAVQRGKQGRIKAPAKTAGVRAETPEQVKRDAEAAKQAQTQAQLAREEVARIASHRIAAPFVRCR